MSFVGLGDYEVHCPSCRADVRTSFDQISRREELGCSSCGSNFPIQVVYDYYYTNDPAVRVALGLIRSNPGRISLSGGNEENRRRAEEFVSSTNLNENLGRMAFEMVLYGEVFLRIDRGASGRPSGLQFLSPQTVSIELGSSSDQGEAITGRRRVLAYAIRSESAGEERLLARDVIHLRDNRDTYPYGDSSLRINLRTLRILELLRARGSDWSQLASRYEGELMMSLGVPPILARGQLGAASRDVAGFAVDTFMSYARSRHQEIGAAIDLLFDETSTGGSVERPTVSWRGPNRYSLLVQGGYDISEDIASVRRLREAGIITGDEMNSMIREMRGQEG